MAHKSGAHRRVSLGALCFGFPQAEGCASPRQHAPDPWREAFRTQFADADVRLGLFRSCKTGRDHILQAAASASLLLDLAISKPDVVFRAQRVAAEEALATRGDLPTTLQLLVADDEHAGQPLSSLSPLLFSCAASVCELRISAPGRRPEGWSHTDRNVTAIFQNPALPYPTLTSLSLKNCCFTLPPTTHLPQLQRLSIQGHDTEVNGMVSGVRRFLPQLTALSLHTTSIKVLDPDDGPSVPWGELFNMTTIAHNLTELSVHTLDEYLVTLLLDHAPALTHLTVKEYALVDDVDDVDSSQSGPVWGLERLTVEAPQLSGWQLYYLPKSTVPRVVVEVTGGTLDFSPMNPQGYAWVAERLSAWSFHVSHINMRIVKPRDPDTPSGLRNALRQLSDLQAPGAVIELCFTPEACSAELGQVVADALPALPHLSFRVVIEEALTDVLLGAAVQMGPHVRSVAAEGLEVLTNQHGNTPWPWEQLTLEAVNVPALVRLPHPGGGTGPRTVWCRRLSIDGDALKEGRVERLQERLQHIRFAPTTETKNQTLAITLESTPGSPDSSRAAMLSVLQAVQLDSDTTVERSIVQLVRWPMTHEAMSALQGLPQWAATLDLTECTWPLEPTEYSQLAQSVPTSYKVWRLGMRIPPLRLYHIREGVRGHRAALGLQPVRVEGMQALPGVHF